MPTDIGSGLSCRQAPALASYTATSAVGPAHIQVMFIFHVCLELFKTCCCPPTTTELPGGLLGTCRRVFVECTKCVPQEVGV